MLAKERKRILVVDDDNLICWALEKELTGAGYYSRAVEKAGDALTELRSQSYDVVFLDVRLPDGDGIDILPEIGKISPESKTVIMSGKASEENRRRAFERGAVKFLDKPFDLSQVHSILGDALSGRLRKREHARNECRIPLRITILKRTPEESRYSMRCIGGTMSDVGLGGFKVRTKLALGVGEHVRVHAEAAGTDPATKLFSPQAAAEVVWVASGHDNFTAGLKYLPDDYSSPNFLI